MHSFSACLWELNRVECNLAIRRDGAGFITTGQLREIIAELDPRLTSDDLDGIIEEIDEDGSGTMDFDEFCQMMMSK